MCIVVFKHTLHSLVVNPLCRWVGRTMKITPRISVKAAHLHALCLSECVCRELINTALPTAGRAGEEDPIVFHGTLIFAE